jgi:hypothetical protein
LIGRTASVKFHRSDSTVIAVYASPVAERATNPGVRRVMALVMKKLGLTRANELARVLELPPYSEGSVGNVRKWIRGEHGPSFDTTMLMLSKAGLLTDEADRAWKGLDPLTAGEAKAAGAASAAEAERLRSEREAPSRRKRQTQ